MAFLSGWLAHYPLLSYQHLGLQIALIIHVLVNRRQLYWIFLIFFIPVIGVLAYLFVEVLPDLRRGRRLDLAPVMEGLRSPEARIKARREQLAELDTLQNRVALAAELTRAGRLEEAEAILEPARTGIYKDDPQLLYQLADLKYGQGKYAEARALLLQVDAMRSQTLAGKTKVLLADTARALGEPGEAERYYREGMGVGTSEEPRVKLAQLLLQEGRSDEARGLLEQIERTYRRANSLYRSQEREWFRLAGQLRQEVRSPRR